MKGAIHLFHARRFQEKVHGTFFVLLFVSTAFAHNGAHPDNPDTFNARGGIVKESKTFHVEAIPLKKSASLYLFDSKMKPVKDVSKMKVQARLQNNHATLNIVLEPMGDHFNAPYPREPLRRYKLVIVITDKQDEVVIFDIDPSKIPTPAKN